MIKMLHCADLHVGMENYGRMDPATGVNGRVLDFLHCLDVAIDYGMENGMDLFLFAGDAFRTRTPSPTYQRAFARRIMRLAHEEIPVILLAGNHDLPAQVQRATALDIFPVLGVPGVIVARFEAKHFIQTRGGSVQVCTVPYPVRQRLLVRDEYDDAEIRDIDHEVQRIVTGNIEALAAQLESDIPAVLAAHVSVSGAEFGSERSVMIGQEAVVLRSALIDSAWDYVALGHVHKHQSLNDDAQPPIVYAGSMERVDFGEEGQPKGFCWVELECGHADWQFVELPAREFKTIRIDVRDSDDPLAVIRGKIERIGDVTEAVVRLIIQHRESQREQLPDPALRAMLAGAYHVASITREVERDERVRLAGVNLEALDDEALLGKYLEITGVDGERAAMLMGHASDVFREVADGQA